MIVGAGVVLAASYEAKRLGVRTAMGVHQAKRLCPYALPTSRMSAYSDASKAVFAVFEEFAPVVEGLSIDEAFLDVRGLERISGRPAEIAARLRDEVRAQWGCQSPSASRGRSPRRRRARWPSRDGLLVVPPDEELAFLHPLPVERLWGVGTVTAAKLRARASAPSRRLRGSREATLVGMLGRASGRHRRACRQPGPAAGAGRAAATFDRLPARARAPAPDAG